ncbi:MAG: hypothetical protein FWE13_02295, partial [Firmicutes bacterium]|nr:hypothetical protein [Bacillota bacterium]
MPSSVGAYRQLACPHTRSHMQAKPLVIEITEGIIEWEVFISHGDSFYIPVYFTNSDVTASLKKESTAHS